MLAHRERRRWRRCAPAVALAALAFGCGAGADDAGPPPLREGSVKTLSDADTLLFGDQVGSLTKTTSGTGTPRGSFAAQPFGPARWDTTGESRPYAGGVRDRGVGLDVMGLRALAPDLGVWTSPDPEALASPERGLGDALTANNPYAYAGQTPLVARDEDGQWWQMAAGAFLGAAVGAGVEAYRQYQEHGRIESGGKVWAQAGVGAISGLVSASAGPPLSAKLVETDGPPKFTEQGERWMLHDDVPRRPAQGAPDRRPTQGQATLLPRRVQAAHPALHRCVHRARCHRRSLAARGLVLLAPDRVARAARERGEFEALAPKARGPKPHAPDPRVADLARENERLRARSERAEALVEVQRKIASLLGTPFDGPSGKRS